MSDPVILSGVEAVRKRPGMYIGSTGPRAIPHMLWETAGNVIDEHLAGHATRLDIHHGPDGSWRVADNGRGIDPARFDSIFCEIHKGATLDGHLPHVHVQAGHGVGMAVICALSSWMRVEVRRQGIVWQQLYVQGEPVGELTELGACTDTGTVVHYLPDLQIFTHKREEHPTPDNGALQPRLRELAALTPGLEITMQGVDYSAPEGLAALVEARAPGAVVGDTMRVRKVVSDIDIDVAVAWDSEDSMEGMLGELPAASNQLFANYVETVDTAQKLNLMLASTRSRGRHAVVSVLMLDPRFAGPTRQKLDNPEVIRAIRKVIKGALPEFLSTRLRYRNPMVPSDMKHRA